MNRTLYKHEMKMNAKSLFIWTLCVGLICFGCMILYTSLEDSMQGIADSFSDMGAMSAALGMDKMSLATLKGYFATEIAMMHSLGGAMFAAILGIGLISKEESAHTTEFLNVFPITRKTIITSKYLALVSNIFLCNLTCAVLYCIGFFVMKDTISIKEMLLYHAMAFFMHLEIGSLCFLISAFTRKAAIGTGLGITLLLFAADMMCRIVPSLENLKYLTPFYFSNAADLFTSGMPDSAMLMIGAGILVCSYICALFLYEKRDLQ